MTLLVCWLVFPLVLAAICLGCGKVRLVPGAHTVELRQTSSWLDPGSGGPAWPIGPLVLSAPDRC